MGKETPRIPSGQPSAFTVIRPKLTVSPYVRFILRRKRDACPPEHPSEQEFNPDKPQLEQPWYFSEKANTRKPTLEVDDIELADIQKEKKVNAKSRGKWVLNFTGSSQVSIHNFWKRLSERLEKNPINGCSCTLKSEEKCIYVYSCFEDCLKVHSVLRKIEHMPLNCEFRTPQHGVLLKR